MEFLEPTAINFSDSLANKPHKRSEMKEIPVRIIKRSRNWGSNICVANLLWDSATTKASSFGPHSSDESRYVRFGASSFVCYSTDPRTSLYHDKPL